MMVYFHTFPLFVLVKLDFSNNGGNNKRMIRIVPSQEEKFNFYILRKDTFLRTDSTGAQFLKNYCYFLRHSNLIQSSCKQNLLLLLFFRNLILQKKIL